MRKGSTKGTDDRLRRPDPPTPDNEYYLPHPHVRIVKTPLQQTSTDLDKDKMSFKYQRKSTQHTSGRTLSTHHFKNDLHNLSKDQDPSIPTRNNAAKKVQSRKIRSHTNCETPRKMSSKSAFKLTLNNPRKEVPQKRLNLKIEGSTAKKGEKISLQGSNFDSYYNNDRLHFQSKTARGPKGSSYGNISGSSQFGVVFTRCKKLIEDYQQQLQIVKKENKALLQENGRLKQQNPVHID